MALKDFSISINPNAVEVRHTPSETSPRAKLYGFCFSVVTSLALGCFLFFAPGKHGQPSTWHDLTSAKSVWSAELWFDLALAGSFTGLFGWYSFHYDRAASPSDETLHCDREALTICRVPWLDFSNRTWRTYTYPLPEVSHIRFAVLASSKTSTIWGLRFKSHGRKWTLPGLEAPEAKTILAGLRALGADVPDDPKLEKRIRQAMEMRDGDTSWMDRSWMDANSNTDHKN